MLNHKYNLGDAIYGIYRAPRQNIETCTKCGGDGTAKWSSGVSYSCYCCHGTGKNWVSSFYNWELVKTEYGIVRPMTVGMIRCEVRNQNGDHIPKNAYMCHETGVGSGTMWEESILWPSKSEAQDECDRRNRKDGE